MSGGLHSRITTMIGSFGSDVAAPILAAGLNYDSTKY